MQKMIKCGLYEQNTINHINEPWYTLKFDFQKYNLHMSYSEVTNVK